MKRLAAVLVMLAVISAGCDTGTSERPTITVVVTAYPDPPIEL